MIWTVYTNPELRSLSDGCRISAKNNELYDINSLSSPLQTGLCRLWASSRLPVSIHSSVLWAFIIFQWFPMVLYEARMAEWIERATHNVECAGSSPHFTKSFTSNWCCKVQYIYIYLSTKYSYNVNSRYLCSEARFALACVMFISLWTNSFNQLLKLSTVS